MLKSRRRILLACVLAAAFLGIALIALLRSFKPLPTVTLIDGNVVSLVGVTTGPSHSLTYGLNWDGIFGWLPHNLRQSLPRGSNHFDASRLKAPLAVWIKTTQQIPYSAKATISGEDRIELFSRERSTKDGEDVSCFSFHSFPTTSKKLTAAILLEQSPGTYIRAGEFTFDNPLYAAPASTSKSLPQTASSGPLSVTLQSLQVRPYWVSPKYEGLTTCCRAKATFDVVEQGETRNRWRPCGAKVLTSSGSPFPSDGYNAGYLQAVSISFDPYTSPDTPWKLQVEFEKARAFDSSELITFENIPLSNDSKELALSQAIDGMDLTISKIVKDPVRQGDIEIFTRLSPCSPDRRLSLATAKTDAPGQVGTGGSSGHANEKRFDLYYVPDNATTITLTFAVHKSYTFEFLAQPSVVTSFEKE